MKKIIAMIMISVMMTLSVAGCGGGGNGNGSSTASEAPAAENTAESVSEDANTDAISAAEYTDNVFQKLINMEIGTAGSSLKEAQIAEEILSFAADRQISDTEETARKAAFSEAWNSLSNEEKEVAKHNFYEEEIADLIDSAFDDYESVRGRFEDAGVSAEMEELSKSEEARKSWNTLRELMSDMEQ